MNSRLRITHTSGFRYRGPVVASYNEARMTPLTTPTQTTLEARIELAPAASTYRYWDYWGTQVTAFDLRVSHEELRVIAHSLVETRDGPPIQDADAEWDVVRSAPVEDEYAELLQQTPRTLPPQELVALTADVAADLRPDAAAREVSDWIRSEMEYVQGVTQVQSGAEEAWRQRKGVCQDFAHLAVGALRSLGIPARYVSGYLHPRPDAALGETVAGQSHAWIEWWSGAWQAYDPTNGKPLGHDHVVVARGRDYGDVPPLRGVYSGPAATATTVVVEVTRVA